MENAIKKTKKPGMIGVGILKWHGMNVAKVVAAKPGVL